LSDKITLTKLAEIAGVMRPTLRKNIKLLGDMMKEKDMIN